MLDRACSCLGVDHTPMPVQWHITDSSRQKWERYTAKLEAARRQAASAAQVAPIRSVAERDAAQCSGLAAMNGAAGQGAADVEIGDRPLKRARMAVQAPGVELPPQHSAAHDVCHGQPGAPNSSATTQSSDHAGAESLPALAAEQLDGSGCHGADAAAGWPPDMHDTVGCVLVSANGASLHSAVHTSVVMDPWVVRPLVRHGV